MQKKGVSAVIATVLVIMITISAVAIIWATVIPMIKDSLTDSTSQQVSLSIETSSGYTVYDPVTNYAFVQVKRGTDDSNLTGLKIIFFNGEESKSVTLSDVPPSNTLPVNNGKVYSFYLGDFGRPIKVSVAPIFTVGKSMEVGKILDEVSNIATNGVSISLAQASSNGKVYDINLGDVGLETLRDGLVGYWPLDSDANDYSGLENNGVCINMDSTCNSVGGKVGNAFSFNSADSTYTNHVFNNPLLLKEFTLEAWFKGSSGMGTLAALWSAGVAGSGIGMGGGKIYGRILDAGVVKIDLITDETYNDSNWNQVFLTFDGGKTELYVNGNLKKSKTLIYEMTGNNSGARSGIGTGSHWGHFNGTIDEVAIWNRVLNDSEISQLYNGGNGRSLK